MTEISENNRREIHWGRFLVALIVAPFPVAAIAYPFSFIPNLEFAALIPYFAILFGGPVYLLFGAPILIWFLRRQPPRMRPIVTLSVISLAGIIPIAVIIWAVTREPDVFQMLSGYLFSGAVFAPIWSGTFVLIYKRLTRNL